MQQKKRLKNIKIPFVATAGVSLLTGLMINNSYAFLPSFPRDTLLIDEQTQQINATCPHFYRNKSTQTLPQTFTMINWNIYKQNRSGWEISLRHWAVDTDIITLQEAKLSQSFTRFAKTNHFFYLQNAAFFKRNQAFGTNTLSRVAANAACGTTYSEPWIRIPKSALVTRYTLANQQLLVVNIHAVNFTFGATPLAEQLSPLMRLIQMHQGPVIFSGDFNTWTDKRFTLLTKSMTDMGLTSLALSNDNRVTTFGLPLDHIYYRDLNIVKANSFNSKSSDHNPIKVTFSAD